MSTLDTKFAHDNSNANNALLRSKLVLGNIGWRLSSTIHGHSAAQHGDYNKHCVSTCAVAPSSWARGQWWCRSGFRLYRLSPFPSLSVKILNAEFAAKLIITTNFEFIVFHAVGNVLSINLAVNPFGLPTTLQACQLFQNPRLLPTSQVPR